MVSRCRALSHYTLHKLFHSARSTSGFVLRLYWFLLQHSYRPQQIHYNFIHRVYLTPRKLHLMKVINGPVCTFCSSNVIGSFFFLCCSGSVPQWSNFGRWLPLTYPSSLTLVASFRKVTRVSVSTQIGPSHKSAIKMSYFFLLSPHQICSATSDPTINIVYYYFLMFIMFLCSFCQTTPRFFNEKKTKYAIFHKNEVQSRILHMRLLQPWICQQLITTLILMHYYFWSN